MLLFNSLDRYRDQGLLLLRAGIGGLFFIHGLNKLKGGTALWEQIGNALGVFGIHFAPTFWGLMATASELLGGLLLALGLFFRPALFFMVFTMIVAVASNLSGGFNQIASPLTMLIVLTSLIFIGPGRYSIDGRRKG